MMINMAHVLVTLTALAGCLHDLSSRRIPNYLTFGSAALALVYALATTGWSGVGIGLGGWALGVALFIPFFLLRGMGAGDVKLAALIGATFGLERFLAPLMVGVILGGAVALVLVIARGRGARSKFAYGPSLAAGAILALIFSV